MLLSSRGSEWLRTLMTYRGKYVTVKTIKKFESYFTPIDSNKCWLWNGSLIKGYGEFYSQSQKISAHRFMYILKKGIIPKNLEICHTCDNPRCINPNHLEAKSHYENIQDCIRRGREPNRKGSKCPNSKLTEREVLNIRKEFISKTNVQDLALKYHVRPNTIHQIISRRNWKHI